MKKSLLSKDLLEKKIKQRAQEYYEGNPTVSDSEFDNMVDELRKEDPENDVLNQVGWGYDVSKVNGKKIPHSYGTVGSLLKVHSIKELPAAYRNNWVVCVEKLDGASCVAYYNNGNLVFALSRGNGEIGIDITKKYNKITQKYDLSVIKQEHFTGAIRGEIVMSNESWEFYKEKNPDAKSPRNVATGLMMRDDVSDDLQYIDFVTYKIHGWRGSIGNVYYEDVLDKLKEFGFPVCWYFDGSIENAFITDEVMKKQFLEKPNTYPCDGIVIQLNNGVKVHDNGGVTYTDIAYKFEAHKENTVVVDVEWNLSKNNIMIPVVVVEPVELSGAIVTRATAFNRKYIEENKIGKGSVISLTRSGEVIPCIKEVIKSIDKVNIPTVCPVCGETLTTDGVNLVCANPNCPNIEKSRLYTWIETVGVRNILGVGPTIINDLIKYFKSSYDIDTVSDLYNVINSGVVSIDLSYMFTPVTAEKVKQITKNFTTPIEFYKVLIALNIKGLGDVNAKKLASIIYDNIGSDFGIAQALRKVKGIGAYIIGVVIENRQLIENAINNTVPVITPAKETYKYQITVTGALSIPREEFKKVCEQNKILLSDNIKTSKYLITNNPNSGSSKLQKANKLNIPILTEKEFVMLEDLVF